MATPVIAGVTVVLDLTPVRWSGRCSPASAGAVVELIIARLKCAEVKVGRHEVTARVLVEKLDKHFVAAFDDLGELDKQRLQVLAEIEGLLAAREGG